MDKMKMFCKLEFFAIILLACSALMEGFVNNPSILWDSKNPIFQTNYSISVLLMSKIKIVCPNPAMIPTPVDGSIPKEEMYENLWLVEKQAYDACAINSSKYQNKLLMKCDTPLQLRYFTIVFQQFSAIADGLVFGPGKNYYFIATSSGSELSLGQTSGGRCSTHNMRLMIYVCKDANDPKCITSPVVSTVAPPTETVTVCPTPTQTVYVSSTSATKQPYCSAALDKQHFSEMLNNTRLIPEILNHTSQLAALWAQFKNMSDKLTAVQDKLDNCSFGQMALPPPTLKPTPTPVYADCLELYNAGIKVSGVYVIKPQGLKPNELFPVFCDQTTPPGGWLVIQKRFDGSVRFSDRKWVEYQNGFGNVTGEFWLGLNKIYLLAKNPMRLRFDLGAPNGTNLFAVYQGFKIAGADQKYKLTSGTYIAGDCGNAFGVENGNLFSTVDQDNDKLPNIHCAQTYKSGWWHGRCHQSSLNGLYLNGSVPSHFADGITWFTWLKSYKYFFTKSEMKIKPAS